MVNFEGAKTKAMNEPGRLLWVCRRNGTWWPSQILSLDQVPESYMSSRKPGTPVKFLGKENAIIEWYNIETSKRIKAFRCSEFDECIEKAKTSTNNLSRISAKYARREDAILHALRLEGAQKLEDKPHHKMARLSSPLIPDKVNNKLQNSSKFRGNSNFDHELPHYDISSEDTNFVEQISRKRKMNFPNNSEEVKNFRGVEEHGVRLECKRGSKFEVKSLDHLNYLDSGPDASGAAVQVILDTNIQRDVDPRHVDAELVTTQKVLPQLTSGPFLESSDGMNDQVNLFDVKVEVQTSYKSQSVPFTCTESRLTGHSIVGHPINIEVLDRNSIDNILSGVSKMERISSSIRVSSLIHSEEKCFQKVIPEAKDPKNTFTHCVPVSQIFSRLKEAL
ncbi:hypothetical protein POM88_051617 [Heracleum sosnowskyi]|uniref:PWWP domain-containing protein n=1 Tax=Heracleum sosnowskyi TaxID=360622 RepID=A0AAD8H2K7_9APIA|nr:hypothetical protein POM88_051617 [Heracleum sosnowskyi]